MREEEDEASQPVQGYDAIVVGAGIGGLYAIHRLRQQGLTVLGLESAAGVGGVWYHNRYPGARVDVESCEYCYHFSDPLFREWKWTERYAAQPELLLYLNHVADRLDIRRHILFETRMSGATWHPEDAGYRVETSRGGRFTCRFLIMASGNLSAARKPDFPGLDDFAGEWVQTSHWPERPVAIAGRRIAVIGTGSSGVQTIPTVAAEAAHVHVFQRSPNYSVPASNGPPDEERFQAIGADLAGKRARLMSTRAGITSGLPPMLTYAEFDDAERLQRLERQWAHGGQGMNRVFTDQGINQTVNDAVSEFVRGKIREIVKDPEVAERLSPRDHPIGSRRLCVDTDYYATYNRDNVTLVDLGTEPVERITETGIRTTAGHYEVDLIVFALGFDAFRGALDRAGIRNEAGARVTDRWDKGPRTLLGIMTSGFPNLFFLTGPGSPSVLSNMVLMNEEHANWVADLIGYMDSHRHEIVEAEATAEDEWGECVAEAASQLLRLNVKNYMVHVNDDGSRAFMPYVGGMDRYAEISNRIAADGYQGFRFSRVGADAAAGPAAYPTLDAAMANPAANDAAAWPPVG